MRLLLASIVMLAVCLFATPSLARGSESFAISSLATSLSSSQAGGHPDFTTSFAFATDAHGDVIGQVKNVRLDLPPGLLGDPQAAPRCTPEELSGFDCQTSAQVGVLNARFTFPGQEPVEERVPVYNMIASTGHTGTLAATLSFVPVLIQLDVRRDGSYALAATIEDLSTLIPLQAVSLTLWGVPADPSHDPERVGPPPEHTTPTPAGVAPTPFMFASTDCSDGPLENSLSVESWQGASATASASMPAPTGCDLLTQSSAALGVIPETTQATSPSGYEVDVSTPQDLEPYALATPSLRSLAVKLPLGTAINPSAANGLSACSPSQFSLASDASASCPRASTVGSVQIDTPLLAVPLTGTVYLAEQGANPFGSLIALYLIAEGGGVQVKLAGRVALNPTSGQLSASFADLPQLPFSLLRLRFTGGPGSLLSNPRSCGQAQSTAQLATYSSAPPLEISSAFGVSGCAPSAFAPTFAAGTSAVQAGASTALSVSVSRGDPEQPLGALSVSLPAGIGAMLGGVGECPEPQAAVGECGSASLLGHVTVAIGAGPDPYWIQNGAVFLTGPYGGGPFGLAIVVPAVAGPLSLGQLVVRAAIDVSPASSALTIVLGSLPQILDGIPLQLRAVDLTIDRPGFMFDPTNCERSSVYGVLTGIAGATALVSSPFQVTGCASLPFKPGFAASTRGNASFAGNGASLLVKITPRSEGTGNRFREANLKSVHVELPHMLPTRLSTLQHACTGAQFATSPLTCPPASVVGSATIRTPVLAVPLRGPAYLVSHGGAAFPDLVLVLEGDGVTLELTGKTEIRQGVTYTHFDALPDSPIDSFELELPEGQHSVLSATTDLCRRRAVTVTRRISVRSHGHTHRVTQKVKETVIANLRMPTRIEGQNNAAFSQTTSIGVTGCPKPKRAKATHKT